MADVYRERLYEWFGNWEVCVDSGLFEYKPEPMFSKKNFKFLYCDPPSGMIALCPEKGMHKRLWDAMERLPNREECKELWEHDKVATYHFKGLTFFEHHFREFEEDDLDCLYDDAEDVMECYTHTSRLDWLKEHPNSISLLLD